MRASLPVFWMRANSGVSITFRRMYMPIDHERERQEERDAPAPREELRVGQQ